MCQMDKTLKYDQTNALDSQEFILVKETIFKFDEQPMSSFKIEGTIYIDDFGFDSGVDASAMKLVGIDKLYDSTQSTKSYAYNETVTGVIGLGPRSSKQDLNFMNQLKSKGVIDYLTFSISSDYSHIDNS